MEGHTVAHCAEAGEEEGWVGGCHIDGMDGRDGRDIAEKIVYVFVLYLCCRL